MPEAQPLEVPWKVKSRADVDAHDSPNVFHREPRRNVNFMDEPEDAKACLRDSGGSESHGPDRWAAEGPSLRGAACWAGALAPLPPPPRATAMFEYLAHPPTDT